MAKHIFVNLPVSDLDKSKDFFSKLGFQFDVRFTDKNATCMILGENLYAMLLVKPFFKNFTEKKIADAKKETEVLTSLSVSSRDEVDRLVDAAVQHGAKEFKPNMPQAPPDFMYNRDFEDLDGHIWEILYMDESKIGTRSNCYY